MISSLNALMVFKRVLQINAHCFNQFLWPDPDPDPDSEPEPEPDPENSKEDLATNACGQKLQWAAYWIQ